MSFRSKVDVRRTNHTSVVFIGPRTKTDALMVIFIHQHDVVGNETKIHKTVTKLWHMQTHVILTIQSILTALV